VRLTDVLFISIQIIMHDFSLPEWNFIDPCAKLTKSDASHSVRGYQYSECHFQMNAKRNAGFYFWNIMFPTSLICSLGFLAFGVENDDIGGRLGVILTLLLTAVAFKMQTADFLPKLATFTLLDNYISSAFLLLYAIALVHATTCMCHTLVDANSFCKRID
jgi:hypothetical protein